MFSTIRNDRLTASASSNIPNHHHHHLCMGCNKAYYLNFDDHPLGSIINIAIGKTTSPEVNVNEALQTGKDQMRTFQTGWPETFYSKMSRVMKTHKKKLPIGDTPVIDQGDIYARVIGLFISNSSLDFNVILTSELSAYPPLMLDPTGVPSNWATNASHRVKCHSHWWLSCALGHRLAC